MLWIKEVEIVDSVDDLKSSCSVKGIRMPDFEVHDAKIASALNRIIHNTIFKRKVSLEEPCTWSWNNQDLSDEETFARLTHVSSDGSESNCGSCGAPKPVDSSGIPFDTFTHTDDGWGSSRGPPPVPPGLPSTSQSS